MYAVFRLEYQATDERSISDPQMSFGLDSLGIINNTRYGHFFSICSVVFIITAITERNNTLMGIG